MVFCSFVSTSTRVTNLYGVQPYAISSSLRFFIALLIEPNNWHLQLLSDEHSVRICFIVSEAYSPQLSHVLGCWPLYYRQFTHTLFGNMYIISVLSDSLFHCIVIDFDRLLFSVSLIYVCFEVVSGLLSLCAQCRLWPLRTTSETARYFPSRALREVFSEQFHISILLEPISLGIDFIQLWKGINK